MKTEIRTLAPVDVLPLRQRVLRPHQQVHETVFEGDEAALHLGVYVDEVLCSIATFMRADPPDGADPDAWRLRGMATAPEHRGQGYGSQLIVAGREALTQLGATRIWFNARTTAAGFYAKQGFEQLGEVFELPKIGPHVVMHAWL